MTVSGGIWSIYGDITLGWTSATDYITASGFTLEDGQHVKIADGQWLYGDGFPSASFTGTVDDPSALNGLMLRPTAAVTKSGTNEYTILNAAGWDAFCDRLAADDGKTFFTGKTVKLADDITVSRMAGSDHHDFCGTFDGGGHTLTFNYSTDANDAAPFRYVEDCVIENLRVCGTIETSAKYAAGLVAHQYGNVTIRNCRSSVTIKSSVSSGNGDGTHGGFVAENCKDGDITFEGCLFDGKLLTTGSTATTRCGGFVGWRSNNTEAVIKVKNSLYAPAALEVDEMWVSTTESATFVPDGIASDITNSYYTSDFNDGSSFTGQGKQRRSIAAGEGVTLSHAGVATEYSVSGITAYKASDAHGDNDPFIDGLVYDEVLFAGSGDAVSLTLANSSGEAPLGYYYPYSANAGTLSGSTLTMPDEDVTVSVDTEVLAPIDWTTVSSGDSEADPYIIYNKDQLDLLAQRVNSGSGDAYAASGYEGKYFELGGDIEYSHNTAWKDATSTENNYTAIGGTFGDNNYYFQGHFDGKGHTVRGIRIYNDSDYFQGIFGKTGSGADVRGITLADARITGYHYTGGIVGSNELSTVSDCHVTADVIISAVQSNAFCHGGIAGENLNGTVSDCTSAATLTTTNAGVKYYGGIVGFNVSGTLRHNLAIGAVVPLTNNNTHGAISGANDSGTLQNNYYYDCRVASNDVTATRVGCGGIRVDKIYEIDDVTNGAEPGIIIYDHSSRTDLNSYILATVVNHTEVDEEYEDFVKVPLVALAGRTLYKDGDWNTLCLPFYIDKFAGTPLDGDGLDARFLDSSDFSDGTLTLTFTAPGDVSCIDPGDPYIIKWSKPDGYVPYADPATDAEAYAAWLAADADKRDIHDPVFTDVYIPIKYTTADDITASFNDASCKTETDYVDFIGTYSPIVWETENNSVLFLGGDNTLYFPQPSGSEKPHVNAFRGYFQLKGLTASEVSLARMNFDEETTSLSEELRVKSEEFAGAAWYTLDGRRLEGKPTSRGLYIHGNRKVVVK